ncbi:MAG: S9 family peptidase [bacterium]
MIISLALFFELSSTVIWTAPEGQGSAFRSVSARNQILWGEGDRLVFPWEGDGWTHLYSIPATGGQPKLLTPGKFEVQFVSLARDGKEVVYDSNQNDIDRKHLWRVSVSGGKPKQITSGKGLEWSPVGITGDEAVAFLASGAREPAYAAVIGKSGSLRRLAPETLSKEFPKQNLVEPQQVIFSAADGKQIHGQLFLPSDIKPGEKRPAVLFFHGGSRRQMLLGFHHRQYYHNAYALNQFLANRGYIVLSVNYRSGIGYGMAFREALNYGARGASEFHDVMGAGLYLRSRPDVDPERIGLWGGSYGGYLTALGLARASDLFAAGVDLHGVHDWNVVIRNFVPVYDAASRAEVARLAFESSPMASIKDWRSPALVIHGDDDRNVPFSETVDLVESLRRQGVQVEQVIFPDEVHGFLLHANWLAAYRAAADFFDRTLKKKSGVTVVK